MADIVNNFSYPVILDDNRDPDVSWTNHVRRGSSGGVDLAYPYGSPVLANAAGRITNIAWYGTGGHTVRLTMDDGRYIEYMHLSQFSVANGASVSVGSRIGLSGASGNQNLNYYAPHLHVHMYIGATRVNLFHYFGSAIGLFRQVVALPSGWQDLSSGLTLRPDVMSSLNMGGTWPYTLMTQGGLLYEIAADSSGWRVTSTGVPLTATSISAVERDDGQLSAMAIEGGKLFQVVKGPDGWQKHFTERYLVGKTSAVYVAGNWPVVMLSQGGVLYYVHGDTRGWHVASTGINVGPEISAVYMGGVVPQVMSVEGGWLYQIWGDSAGWHKASTGVAASGKISAVNMGGQWPQVILSENNKLFQIVGTTSGWKKMSLGVSGSSRISAVDMGGDWPQVLKIG